MNLARLLLSISLCLLPWTNGHTASFSLAQVQQMYLSGDSERAYALLQPFENKRQHDVEYNYLLGATALATGRHQHAVTVLEKVYLQLPYNADVVLALASAYMADGKPQQAQLAFMALIQLQPPANIVLLAQQALMQLALQQPSPEKVATAYLETRLGYDNNVLSSTHTTQVYLPALKMTWQLDKIDPRRDLYLSQSAGLNITKSLSPRFMLLAGVDGNRKLYEQEKSQNSGYLSLNTNLFMFDQQNRYSLGGSLTESGSDGTQHSRTGSLTLSGTWPIAKNDYLNLFLQHSATHYLYPQPGGRDSRYNSRANISGASWSHNLSQDGQDAVTLNLLWGQDKLKDPAFAGDDGDNRYRSIGLALQKAISAKWLLTGGADWRVSDYYKNNYFIDEARQDRLQSINLGLRWQVTPLYAITPRLAYYKNSSNLSYNDYERADASVGVRYDLK